MSRNSRIVSAAVACTLALGASSGAMARGGGHMASPQHSNGPFMQVAGVKRSRRDP